METWELKLQYLQEVYKKLEPLGKSGDSPTWLVRNTITGRLFVWKEVSPDLERLYQKLQAISSRNLAVISEVVRIGNKVIVIEDYISGSTLGDLMRYSRIEEELAVEIIRQLLEALCVIHGKNIVHRDINPENVLLSVDNVVKLIDFGIAREPKRNQRKDTMILGTAGYAAPEQFGFGQTDAKTDIYSLGVLFHVMLTGSMPEGNVCQSRKYKEFIQKCISLEPANRYQSAQEAYEVLGGRGEQKETAKGGVKTYGRYRLPGFRSNVFWKEVLAVCFYLFTVIYVVESVSECAKTPVSLLLEIAALLIYVIFAFVFLTNYGDWIHRIWPFYYIPRRWEMFVRVALFLCAFFFGYSLEMYVRETLLGIQ